MTSTMYLLRSSRAPITGARDCQLCPTGGSDLGWDQHGLIAWKDGLAERNLLATAVLRANSVRPRNTIGLVREWFTD